MNKFNINDIVIYQYLHTDYKLEPELAKVLGWTIFNKNYKYRLRRCGTDIEFIRAEESLTKATEMEQLIYG